MIHKLSLVDLATQLTKDIPPTWILVLAGFTVLCSFATAPKG
jgi:hypothetical protein